MWAFGEVVVMTHDFPPSSAAPCRVHRGPVSPQGQALVRTCLGRFLSASLTLIRLSTPVILSLITATWFSASLQQEVCFVTFTKRMVS